MIGIVVTGHGHFASGLTSSLDLIAGKQDCYVAVDFDGLTEEKLKNDLEAAFESLKECEGILVFSDLPGGSPFKMAVTVSQPFKNVEVIAGTNLPMLCEIALGRTMINDLHTLVQSALNTGKDAILKYETVEIIEDDLSDGI
ncbi:MAG: PTS sugar transporter subunit IIA [Holdemanella sp.]|nr:PTS sugar transporter subunit IIA [Holdemanella sp.]